MGLYLRVFSKVLFVSVKRYRAPKARRLGSFMLLLAASAALARVP